MYYLLEAFALLAIFIPIILHYKQKCFMVHEEDLEIGRRDGQEAVRNAHRRIHKNVMNMAKRRHEDDDTMNYVLMYTTPDGRTIMSIIQLGGGVLYYSWMEGLQARSMCMASLQKFNPTIELHLMAALFHLTIKKTPAGMKLVANIPDVFLKSLIPTHVRGDAAQALASFDTMWGISPLPAEPTPKPLSRSPDETPAVLVTDPGIAAYKDNDTLYIP
ncbi:MAG: hypothetical protein V1848_01580 [Candidatus Magasanikbacteria bacterium]